MNNILFSIFPNERFVDLTLYQFGWEACEPLHSYGPHARNHYLFHYVISGKGKLYATDSNNITHEYHLSSNSGFLICPGTINTYCADPYEPWEYTWVEFDGIKVKELLVAAGLSIDTPIYKPKTLELGMKVKSELLYIAEHYQESALNLIGHLHLFMDQLIKSSSFSQNNGGGKLRDFYIREVISFIEQNYAIAISVEDMAKKCNLNRSYLGKIFKAALNQTPQEFLIQYRMAKACEQLKTTNRSISSISASVGYPNQLHFSRAFRKIYGISPREYKNKNYIGSKTP